MDHGGGQGIVDCRPRWQARNTLLRTTVAGKEYLTTDRGGSVVKHHTSCVRPCTVERSGITFSSALNFYICVVTADHGGSHFSYAKKWQGILQSYQGVILLPNRDVIN